MDLFLWIFTWVVKLTDLEVMSVSKLAWQLFSSFSKGSSISLFTLDVFVLLRLFESRGSQDGKKMCLIVLVQICLPVRAVLTFLLGSDNQRQNHGCQRLFSISAEWSLACVISSHRRVTVVQVAEDLSLAVKALCFCQCKISTHCTCLI